jgi:hypothetical protein
VAEAAEERMGRSVPTALASGLQSYPSQAVREENLPGKAG